MLRAISNICLLVTGLLDRAWLATEHSLANWWYSHYH
jgi:hypothetical protein